MNHTITTFSGIRFDLLAPTVEMVSIFDIAHHLSQVCRWAGATKEFFSVAQHSVFMSHIVPPDDQVLARWALLHDAAEAYTGDITRPLKNLLPEIRRIEFHIMEVIAEKFELEFPEPDVLCRYDDQCIRFEAEHLLKWHDGEFTERLQRAGGFAELTHTQRRQMPARLWTPMNQPMSEIAFALRFRELFSPALR